MNDEVKKTPAPISLKSLMTSSKTVTFDYPGAEGFTVGLCYLSREELVKLRSKCLSQVFNKKTRGFDEKLDEEKFVEHYTEAVVKGWSGLKLKYLKNMILIGEPDDEEAELPYSQENVETLMKNSNDFDTWVTEMVGDLENFTGGK